MDSHFRMIDVGAKPTTHRLAVASGDIVVGAEAFTLIQERRLPKGDVLTLAEIAGIQGAKKAPEIIPLCHPIGLDQVRIVTELNATDFSVTVTALVSVHAKTGIEMEALAAVNAALLTIWDLTKMIEPNLCFRNIRLLAKKGGKSGLWLNPNGVPAWVVALVKPAPEQILAYRTAAVITLSDRASRGEYADQSGVILQNLLSNTGATLVDYRVIPDEAEEIRTSVLAIIEQQAPDLLITTGGTGVSPRDVTPEALQPLFNRNIPGVGEYLRLDGSQYTPLSWSSRAVGGVIGKTLVITLPGSPNAVQEGLNALLPKLIPHLLRIIRGEK